MLGFGDTHFVVKTKCVRLYSLKKRKVTFSIACNIKNKALVLGGLTYIVTSTAVKYLQWE